MKSSFHKHVISATLAMAIIAINSNAYSDHSRLSLRDIAGNWVIVQLGIVPSNGLIFGGQMVPPGASIGSVMRWTFDRRGNCKRTGFVNFDGTGGELSVPLTKCKISLQPNGIGKIEVESPLAGPSVIRIIVVNRDEIAMISADSAVVASTFKRQMIRNRRD